MVSLGVGKNMVRSIRHWCLATKMLGDAEVKNNRGRHLRATLVGERLFLTDGGWDPYLEDVGTLWLIHWLLTTHVSKATTWYFVFNELHQPDFMRSSVEHSISELAQRLPNVRLSPNTLKRDVDVFIRTYVSTAGSSAQVAEESLECPLVELELIYEEPRHNLYAFARGPKDSLPDAILAYALSDYAQMQGERRSFTFDELAYGPLGIGRVFKLDEPSLAERLERLATVTGGAWQFSETAGFKQVVSVHDLDSIRLLDDYYSQQRARTAQRNG